MKRYIGLIVVLAVLLSFISIMVRGLYEYQLCAKSSKWPLATGNILASEVYETSSSSSRKSGSSTMYGARIKYEYSVNNQRYVSDRIRGADLCTSSSSDSAARLVAQYPKGKQVCPAYDPHDPSLAILEPGRHAGDIFELCISIPIILVSIYILIGIFRRKQTRNLERDVRQVAADVQKLQVCPSFRVQTLQDNGIQLMVNKTPVTDFSSTSLRAMLEAHGISTTDGDMNRLCIFIALVASSLEKFSGKRIELIHVLSLIRRIN